jgi:hypothetical protein
MNGGAALTAFRQSREECRSLAFVLLTCYNEIRFIR